MEDLVSSQVDRSLSGQFMIQMGI